MILLDTNVVSEAPPRHGLSATARKTSVDREFNIVIRIAEIERGYLVCEQMGILEFGRSRVWLRADAPYRLLAEMGSRNRDPLFDRSIMASKIPDSAMREAAAKKSARDHQELRRLS